MSRVLVCCAFLLLAACAESSSKASAPVDTETIDVDTREGTTLAFDLAPRDSTIVFDLLGQLWSLPAGGGAANALTDAVRDTAEDLDPSISPDGKSVVFRAERSGRTGLWLLDLSSKRIRQLTQIANPDEWEGNASWSPDGRTIAFTHVAPDSGTDEWYSRLALLDVASGAVHKVRLDTAHKFIRDPVWSPDGKQIAFVSTSPANIRGARIWTVSANGGTATPLSRDSTRALAPAFSPDGSRIAFLARDSADRLQLWVEDLAGTRASAPVRLTTHDDVASTRVRWTHDGNALVYTADGKLLKVDARGGAPASIPFTAHLSVARARVTLPPARFPEPGKPEPARAFLGLALSPDGQSIAALALGKLWIIPSAGQPRALADVPFTARGLAWSPDGNEVAWSAGTFGDEDLFALDVRTGAIRQVTALPGRAALPAYSPDGRYIAFMHQVKEDVGALRVIDAHAATIRDTAQARYVGPGAVPWTRGTDAFPQWSPGSDALLTVGDFESAKPTKAFLARLSGGRRDTVNSFLDAPIFLHWDKAGTLTFVRHDRLWRARFDGRSVREQPRALGADAALYASVSNDGSILYVSEDGLRVRSPAGDVRKIGWPIAYTPPVAAPLLIRNARIIDGNGNPATAQSDILIEAGRITQIAAGGSITSTAHTIDAKGKFVMPGLMELHAHNYRPELLTGFLYFGVTTVRDQGSAIAPLVAYGDGIAAGAAAGPRVMYGAFQFYSDWPFDDEQGRGIEPEADAAHVQRSVALAGGFGAQHIKTRTFRRWDINARMIAEAHRRGIRTTGHCAAPLPLIAASMDAKEHAGLCATRGAASVYASNDMLIYDDEVQLYRAAGVAVIPTISYYDYAARLNDDPKLLDEDKEVAPFFSREDFSTFMSPNPAQRARLKQEARDARATVAKLAAAGVTIGTGTDIWQLPTGVHIELEQLVAAGLSPAQAIRAATSSAAHIIGAGDALGSVEKGKWADLIILDANPLADIRNTRRISAVIQNGHVVDRAAIHGRVTL